MTFTLEITNPEGGRYTYNEDGLTLFVAKYQAACAVMRAHHEIHPLGPESDAHSVRRALDARPVGSPVSIPSGYTFTIKEF